MDVAAKQGRVFVLPGILARGPEQIADVKNSIGGLGCISAQTYLRWNPDKIAAEVAAKVKDSLESGENVTILGISIGGLLTAKVVEKLSPSERRRVRVIIVDSPHGAETLMATSGPLRWFFTSGVYRCLGEFGGGILMSLFRQPPKDENIEVPRTEYDISAYQARVKRTAIERLKGHSWKMYGAQVAWMCEAPKLRALRSVRELTYIACVGRKNDTVAQPLALNRWRAQLPNLQYVDVNTAHAAFLEASETWNEVFSRLVGPRNPRR